MISSINNTFAICFSRICRRTICASFSDPRIVHLYPLVIPSGVQCPPRKKRQCSSFSLSSAWPNERFSWDSGIYPWRPSQLVRSGSEVRRCRDLIGYLYLMSSRDEWPNDDWACRLSGCLPPHSDDKISVVPSLTALAEGYFNRLGLACTLSSPES